MEKMSKFERCRYGFPDFKSQGGKITIENKCTKTNMVVTEKDCADCASFNSRYIEYPITVAKINIDSDTYDMHANRVGEFVKIRPCGKEYENKTFLGILIGDMPIQPHASYNSTTQELSVSMISNPAIFVPDLKKVIFGCESWWGKISSKDDLSELTITDDDINETWYVKALKMQLGEQNDE